MLGGGSWISRTVVEEWVKLQTTCLGVSALGLAGVPPVIWSETMGTVGEWVLIVDYLWDPQAIWGGTREGFSWNSLRMLRDETRGFVFEQRKRKTSQAACLYFSGRFGLCLAGNSCWSCKMGHSHDEWLLVSCG